jgi:hypothetical protein
MTPLRMVSRRRNMYEHHKIMNIYSYRCHFFIIHCTVNLLHRICLTVNIKNYFPLICFSSSK